MYEYAPQFIKKKEKRLCYGCLGLGALLFVASMIEGILFPWIFQILGIGALGGMICLYSLCLTRSYVYRIEDRNRESPDLIITERSGRRVQIVCRISLSSVQSVTPVTPESKKRLEQIRAGRQYFTYTGVLFDEPQYYVAAEECGVPLLLRICADERLLTFLGGSES